MDGKINMDQGTIEYIQAQMLRKQQDHPAKEIELLLWDGHSYNMAYPKRIKIIGKIAIVSDALERIGIDYEEWDFTMIGA